MGAGPHHHHHRRVPLRPPPVEAAPSEAEPHAARRKLLFVAKRLFAHYGYADVALAEIARAAELPQEELLRHFDGKYKLLTAIFDDEWKSLEPRMEDLAFAAPRADKVLHEILAVMTNVLYKDRDLAKLWLFDGYRQRAAGGRVSLPRGFIDFFGFITKLVTRGQRQGVFDPGLRPSVTASLIIAGMEGLVRDWLLTEHVPGARPYSGSEIMVAFNALTAGLRPSASLR